LLPTIKSAAAFALAFVAALHGNDAAAQVTVDITAAGPVTLTVGVGSDVPRPLTIVGPASITYGKGSVSIVYKDSPSPDAPPDEPPPAPSPQNDSPPTLQGKIWVLSIYPDEHALSPARQRMVLDLDLIREFNTSPTKDSIWFCESSSQIAAPWRDEAAKVSGPATLILQNDGAGLTTCKYHAAMPADSDGMRLLVKQLRGRR